MNEQIIAQILEEKDKLVARIEVLEKKMAHFEQIVNKIEDHMNHPTDYRNI